MVDVTPAIVEASVAEATVSAMVTFDVCPFGPAGLSYKPFPITGYPSELEEFLEHVPHGQTSSDAHPLLRSLLKDRPWKSEQFSQKPKKIPKRVLKKLPDHVLERMGFERPKKKTGKKKERHKSSAEKKESPNRPVRQKDQPKNKQTKYCHTCKTSVLAKRYEKHLIMPGHIEKIRSSQGRIPDMSKVYATNFPYGTPEEDELDFPKLESVHVASLPNVLSPLSYPLIPNSYSNYRRERPSPSMINGHYVSDRRRYSKESKK